MDKSDVQETLVSLYLRLNGYFESGFIVHAPRGVKTELDVLAIRFPKHKEPEREVQCCPHLSLPTNRIDFLVGEVKSGRARGNFNYRFRNDAEAIRTVLHRFGAFEEEEIARICTEIPSLLDPDKIRLSPTFPTLQVCNGTAQLRFVLFAPEQRRKDNSTRLHIFENDLLGFVRSCLRPETPRSRCDDRYDFKLWGSQFVKIVCYFKELNDSLGEERIEAVYRACGLKSKRRPQAKK